MEEAEEDEVEGEERPSQIEWRLLVKGCDSDDVSEYDRGQKGGGKLSQIESLRLLTGD